MIQKILNEITNVLSGKYEILDRSFRVLSIKDNDTGKRFEVCINEDYTKEPEPLLTMPRGLCLFHFDYTDDYDGYGHKGCAVGRTYESAFNRFYKRACSSYYSFTYDFYEIEDEEVIDRFVRYHGRENIKAGIYYKD